MGTIKNIYFVLLDAQLEAVDMTHESVGKESIGKKRPVRTFDKKLAAVIFQKSNGLRIVEPYSSTPSSTQVSIISEYT